jgi:Mg2+-importing ATPase
MRDPCLDAPYWSQDPAALMTTLGSGPGGLSSEKATALLRLVGPNVVEDSSRLSALRLLLRQFESPLVLILIFAAAISLVLQQWMDSTIVLAIVLGSTLLGFFQEYRASAAVEELKRSLALTCSVVRDGVERSVPVSTIVPGDIIQLSAGNLIPADGLVIEAVDFLVSEASMTGESFPVEKQPGICGGGSFCSDKCSLSRRLGPKRHGEDSCRQNRSPDCVWHNRGSAWSPRARDGFRARRASVRIPFTSRDGHHRSVRPDRESASRSSGDRVPPAVALAVGLSPELLPAIVSVTLAAGARDMGRRGVLVRRLEAIENIGSMDILCTDKTGTLTEGTIVLGGALDADNRPSAEISQLAFLNAAFENGIENPLDAAIMAAGSSAGLTTHGFTKIDEIPYDFLRRRLTIVVAEDGNQTEHLIVTKGAFSNVLDSCSSIRRDTADVPLTPALRTELDRIFEAKGTEGFRVLAVATRRVAAKPRYGRDQEQDMTFCGFLIFSDPPKADAQRTIHDLAQLGIRIKVISGDNRHVTAHLAKAVGLNPKSMLTGDALGKLRDEALWHLAPRTDLFVEIDPQQKERVVRALQKTGHSVGYLGDGINDAPALHAADVGISVEQAVDVARESADIILLSRDLDCLRSGVEDGRRTFANTLKYISITTSANFGNMLSMALAAPLLPFLPLAAKQILLNNFLSDVPSIAISSDNVDPDRLRRPQRWNIKDIRRFMIVFGLISSAFDLVTFAALLLVFHADQPTFQTFWFVVSLLTELAVVLILRTQRPAFRSRPSRLLLWTTLVVAAGTLAIPFVGRLSSIFGFVPLSAVQMSTVLAIVVGYVAATEVAKAWFYGRRPMRKRQSQHG